MLGGRIGTGRVVLRNGSSIEMVVELLQEPPAPLPVTVILALPRPKVMRRVLYSLTVLGVKRIFLVTAARVEKSFWQTPFLQPEAVRRQLLLGLEQAGDTLLPAVALRPRFKPFVEDELPDLCRGSLGLVAHPTAAEKCPRAVDRPVTMAIGPEGGFVPYEIDMLRSCGLTPVSTGPRILNIETAVPSLIAMIQ